MGVGLQPSLAALLVLAQLPLPIVSPVDLLGSHRQPTRQLGRLVVAAAQPAKHAGRLMSGGWLVGGHGLLGLLAVGGAMFLQFKLNPAPPDPVQAKVFAFMPLVMTFMFMWFPAGLVLYWLTNTVLSIAQQWKINRLVEAEAKKQRTN